MYESVWLVENACELGSFDWGCEFEWEDRRVWMGIDENMIEKDYLDQKGDILPAVEDQMGNYCMGNFFASFGHFLPYFFYFVTIFVGFQPY
jgi:hypothetical protein